jgi:hypothetical protein
MPHNYAQYTGISVKALDFNPRNQEVIAKKQEILQSISQHHGKSFNNILFYGFSPLILATTSKQIAITAIDQSIKDWLDHAGVKYTYINENDLGQYKKQFNWVVAVDEYFTFADSEEDQKQSIEKIIGLAKDVVITTLKDYKNQDFRDREFSQPLAVRNGNDYRIFLEFNDYDFNDKSSWETLVYELQGSGSKTYGPFSRRSMYFKQLAKFSIDAGAKDFYVHKNLMYKSLIKKNYEHVITITL